eukprot:TRINITY_DN24059_c0_g1_i1.p1 TRINITY_DN24059_c0_g1~~TRINITY_DN24059_c0_g1_i1.p1  ORF type:complete len:316 (-),score=26.72 TRINITY_DN24059_c0_g1_i1:408-1277(-)
MAAVVAFPSFAPHPLATPPGSEQASKMPLMPRMNFPPQPVMDSAPEDGPVTVAFGMQKSVRGYNPTRSCPKTSQYPFPCQAEEQRLRFKVQPKTKSDVCGYVQAAMTAACAKDKSTDINTLNQSDGRMVFASITGWTLLFWQSERDFRAGIHGARRAPKPIAWFDLREVYDVNADFGSHTFDTCPHRIRVMMNHGHLFFRVERPEDVPVWLSAIRSLLMDASLAFIESRDSPYLKSKRWPAAKGISRQLLDGQPIGERALLATMTTTRLPSRSTAMTSTTTARCASVSS